MKWQEELIPYPDYDSLAPCLESGVVWDEKNGQYICAETGEVLQSRVPVADVFIDANEKTRARWDGKKAKTRLGGPIGDVRKLKLRKRVKVRVDRAGPNRMTIAVMSKYSNYFFDISSDVPLPSVSGGLISAVINKCYASGGRRCENAGLYALIKEMLRKYGYSKTIASLRVRKNSMDKEPATIVKQAYRFIRRHGELLKV